MSDPAPPGCLGRLCWEMSAGGVEENRGGGGRRRLPKLKNPAKIWKNRRQQKNQNQNPSTEEELDCEDSLQQEEPLEEVSRRLIIREEQLFSSDSPCEEEDEEEEEEEEDRLQRDIEALRLQIWMAVHTTFTSSSSSSGQREVLRSAVASIQQQEVQDRRWMEREVDRVPVWRPQKCLSTHNMLLQNMVESRLRRASEEEEQGGAEGLSSPLRREVCGLGRRVKEDLLMVVRTVRDCYPPHMDIVNVYAGLYHRSFSARLSGLAGPGPGSGPGPGPGLEPDDCSYLLFWINHCYREEIWNHADLQGYIKTACLGSLLKQDHLDRLEDQYLTHKQEKVKLWLNTALKKDEERRLDGKTPEQMDGYCFSPLAVDVIQVMDGSLTEFRCVIRDQMKAERITAQLESLLISYRKSMEDFVKGNHSNVRTVVKAHLVCEQQFRDYITAQTGSLSDEQRRRCLDTLSALRDCGYRCLTCPVHAQLKVSFSPLWTSGWLDGSLPVVDSLLDSVSDQLGDLADLKPVCRQSLLSDLHQDLVLGYVKMMMKTRMKSREQEVGGAQRMIDDARKINNFFSEGGCSESLWLGETLCSLAEILRLQDPGSVQLEVVSLARRFPDLSDTHVTALLSLKTGLSTADVRSIRQSVEENRLHDTSTNHSPPFFYKVKVKWINNKINQMGLKS